MNGERFVLRGGTVVRSGGAVKADVLVDGGRIEAVGSDLPAPGAAVIDATGRLVLPGGVDVHTHIDAEFRVRTCDDFTTGTAAAVAGGTTTVVDFAIQKPGETVGAALERWHAKLEAHPPLADVGAHFAVVDLAPADVLADLARLPDEAGISTLKVYMAYPGRSMLEDGDLFRVMRVAGESGSTVLVHAEAGHVIEVLIGEALAAGHTSPRWHARTRPGALEAEAITRASALAAFAGCSLYVVHVSGADGLAALRAAGEHVRGETCPQYLLLDETLLDGDVEQAARFVCTPPLRTAADQDALWTGLADGALSVVSTDHCPFDVASPKILGDDFTQILNGVPGVEHRLVLLFDAGVRGGRLSLERWVELCCTAPARLAGLAPAKGEIAAGADADLVLFDPERRWTITAAAQRSAVDYTPYEGREVTGAIERVWLRGQAVVEAGEVTGPPGSGRFVRRGAGALV